SVFLCVFVVLSTAANIWPLPKKITEEGDAINLSKLFVIQSESKSDVVVSAITRYSEFIGIGKEDNGLKSIVIEVENDDAALGYDTDYSYEIKIDGDNGKISAKTPYGALYGLETLSEIIEEGKLEHNHISIEDEPTYNHRGIMIDTGRRFSPVHTIKMVIDSMPYNKLNVLHFHLSDWARVAIESKIYPQLTSLLVGDHDGFYTQEEIKDIIEYARLRGVRVIPEIDIPGHSMGFKALAEVGMQFCDSSKKQLYGDKEGRSFKVLSTLLEEILSLFPEPFVHLGCDETETIGVCNVQTAADFEKQIFDFVYNKLGKRPIAWEESLFIKHSMIKEGVVNGWTSHQSPEILSLGYDAIENSNHHFYLDHVNRSYKEMWLNLATVSKLTKCFNNENILFGGEVSMWTDNYCYAAQCGAYSGGKPVGWQLYYREHDTQFEESMLSLIYPRTISAAGTFWRYDKSLDVNSDKFTALYKAANDRLNKRGIYSCPVECSCNEVSKCGKSYL
ncbi:hypothetical protein WA158_002257, partial [Blastocystis sp. Blastoise]